MKEPILIILAAGMGSRYGGLKQIDTVGNNGESIIDFSIYDAIQAGFKKLILIIRREHEELFNKALVDKIKPFISVEYAYQDMADLPNGYKVPEERVKPWGTTHALLACRSLVDAPFMIINADDYYGQESFKTMYYYLTTQITDHNYCMVGYVLNNTLTDYGTVTRGVCDVRDGYLSQIVEIPKIKKVEGKPQYSTDGENWQSLEGQSIVSMNYWGFTPSIMNEIKPIFEKFLAENLETNPLKCEHVLPTAIGELVKNRIINVKVLRTNDKWSGITYREDKEKLIATLDRLKEEGYYPFDLWKK